MKLADLLAGMQPEEIERLAHEHARTDDHLSGPQLLEAIGGVLRSYRFLHDFLFNRQPPAFSILILLLDAPDYSLPTAGFRESVLAETKRICDALDASAILARDDQLRVYRRVLYQARSNDMQIDASEAAILSVLRQELGIAQVEHFLIEHCRELREFWGQEGGFARALHALRSAGLVFVHDGRTVIADDVAPVVRQVLGVDMARTQARRLFGYLTSAELHEALQLVQAATSGTKDEKVERLIAHLAQPRLLLRSRAFGVDRLREICRQMGANTSGAKEELVSRIIAHVAADRDVRGEAEPPPAPPIREQRRLPEERFGLLFAQLRGHELAAISGEFDLRRWGTKDSQVRTLWESHRAEESLLQALGSDDIEALLKRLKLRSSGSKKERILRAIDHFAQSDEASLRSYSAASASDLEGVPSEG
ncbi:SAP domain-containing protein [Sandaracinus amylolyticus]|uniref:SAP domain-containing protein n=1 Tax=Sandaracinus amylolyticus TaxID=927083 RepID=UPI00069CD74D|nr:SAP domain-containing protein [Sandaracinus amylolyticus]